MLVKNDYEFFFSVFPYNSPSFPAAGMMMKNSMDRLKEDSLVFLLLTIHVFNSQQQAQCKISFAFENDNDFEKTKKKMMMFYCLLYKKEALKKLVHVK